MSLNSMSLGRVMPTEMEKSRLAVSLKTLGERFMAAQQARADQLVRPYLARLPIEELRALGFTAAEISNIRIYRHFPVVRWV